MKVLLLCTHLNPGGLARSVINLASGLKRASHEVWVASTGGAWEGELKKQGIPSIRIPLKTKSIVSLKIIQSWLGLKRVVRKEHIELIHAHTRVSQVVAGLLSRSNRIPYVSTFHGFYRPHFFRRKFPGKGTYSIAISRAVREDLIQDFGFDPSRTWVVYNGIDAACFRPALSSGDCALPFRLGILSRLSKEKAIDVIIRLMPGIKKTFPQIQLQIAGEGKQETYLKELVRESDLEHNVAFLGMVDPVDFFKSIDVLLLPSYKEGFGFSVLEAKAAGKIVIAAATGGVRELIRDSSDGFLLGVFTAENVVEILKRLEDWAFFRSVSAQASASARAFSIEAMTSQTLAVYEKALKVTAGY